MSIWIIPIMIVVIVYAAATLEILKRKGVIKPGTPMWKVYIASRILPGVVGVAVAIFVIWYFFIR